MIAFSPKSFVIAGIVMSLMFGMFHSVADAADRQGRLRAWCDSIARKIEMNQLRGITLRMRNLCKPADSAIPVPPRDENQPLPIIPSQPTPSTRALETPKNPAPFWQNGDGYSLTFSEEFDKGLDSDRWIDHAWYKDPKSPKNYSIENGVLKIWPQKDGNGKLFDRDINTDGKFSQRYGYFEMEAKLPHGRWPWPAFWLYNHDGAANYRPEIDIMEAYPGWWPYSGWSDENLRPTAYWATVWTGYPGEQALQKAVQTPVLSAGFHKYAVKWEKDRQTFYFDGKEVASADVSMGDPMYLIVSLQLGSASGEPDATTPVEKSNALEVNYVRAWQFDRRD
jgi:hypothetical protein